MPRSYDYDTVGGGQDQFHPGQQHVKDLLPPTGSKPEKTTTATTAAAAAAASSTTSKQGGEAPCRTCIDFKSWLRYVRGGTQQATQQGHQKEDEASKFTPSPDQIEQLQWESKSCPVDKDELGSATWKFLHTMAAFYPDNPSQQEQRDMKDFFRLFSKLYPCPPCAEELRADLSHHPPQVKSADSLSLWLCQVHNRINRRLGKEEFNCDKVFERWRDGWSDGRCDQ